MKWRNLLVIVILASTLNGCLVKALHPFYKAEDVVFNAVLIGTWIDQDSCQWKIEQYKTEEGPLSRDSSYNHYTVSYYEDDGTVSNFWCTYFILNKKSYLDFYPIDTEGNEVAEFQSFHQIASHSIAKIDVSDAGIIEIKWFKEEWLADLFKNRKIKIAHEVLMPDLPYSQESYIITASTDDIQRFIKKYGDDPLAFECDEGVCITLKSDNE